MKTQMLIQSVDLLGHGGFWTSSKLPGDVHAASLLPHLGQQSPMP